MDFHCHVIQSAEDSKSPLIEILLYELAPLARRQISFRPILAGQESTRQGKVGDYSQSVFAANRLQFCFILRAIVEVVIGLEALVAGEAKFSAELQGFPQPLGPVVGSADRPH